ncbi:MAG: PHP domain-containing protein [Myxococcales bacterium]|nr:PHP domain-containing protein [Myxococcales bacterium]
MIDLHSHTTASDGEHSPEELLALAKAAGVTALAVTDHDTVEGLPACEAAARARAVELVPGIELSVFLGSRELHLLGHFIDRHEPSLAGISARLRAERAKRMEQMVARMRALGHPIALDQVQALAGGAPLTRPHLARALVELGACATPQEAFDRFIGDGKPAWVGRYRLTAAEAIALLRRAGGTATVAHPGLHQLGREELSALAEQGLEGVEVFHPEHDEGQRASYLAMAKELGLVPTGGSDFHGAKTTPDRVLGSSRTSPADFEELRRRASSGPP